MYGHTSFWVSVETPFICCDHTVFLHSYSFFLSPLSTGILQDFFSLSFPSFLFYLSSKTHPSIPTVSAITSNEDASQIYSHSHFQVPAGHLHLEVLLAFKANMSKTELINFPLTLLLLSNPCYHHLQETCLNLKFSLYLSFAS